MRYVSTFKKISALGLSISIVIFFQNCSSDLDYSLIDGNNTSQSTIPGNSDTANRVPASPSGSGGEETTPSPNENTNTGPTETNNTSPETPSPEPTPTPEEPTGPQVTYVDASQIAGLSTAGSGNGSCNEWLSQHNKLQFVSLRVKITKVINGVATFEYRDDRCLVNERDQSTGAFLCKIVPITYDVSDAVQMMAMKTCVLSDTGEAAALQIGNL